MSAQNRTQDKAAKPAGIEDKALAPVVEDKAAEAAPEQAAPAEGVKIVLATHYEYAGEHYAPGDEVVVDADTAYSLRVGGIAARQ